MSAVNVVAVLGEQLSQLEACVESPGELVHYDAMKETCAVVAELIAADKEYDAALTALKDLNRKIAEQGWMDVEFDALRTAGTRLVKAQLHRGDILARIEGAA